MRLREASLQLVQLGRSKACPVSLLFAGLFRVLQYWTRDTQSRIRDDSMVIGHQSPYKTDWLTWSWCMLCGSQRPPAPLPELLLLPVWARCPNELLFEWIDGFLDKSHSLGTPGETQEKNTKSISHRETGRQRQILRWTARECKKEVTDMTWTASRREEMWIHT